MTILLLALKAGWHLEMSNDKLMALCIQRNIKDPTGHIWKYTLCEPVA